VLLSHERRRLRSDTTDSAADTRGRLVWGARRFHKSRAKREQAGHDVQPAWALRACFPDDLVGEEGEAVTDGPGVDEAHALLVAGLVEEALAGPERDRVDHQP
jgi:hypothetical protein